MKIARKFKAILYITLGVLYGAGLLNWILHTWFQTELGPSYADTVSLRVHAVAGLWFLIVFGYLVHSHVMPALNRARKLKTGYSLLFVVMLLIATVPMLYYLGEDRERAWVVAVHTYLGIASLLPFCVHLATKVSVERQHAPPRPARRRRR